MIRTWLKYKLPALAALFLLALVVLFPELSFAQEGASTLDTGDTAWMLTSSALVLMMTIPGLFLFYGGLVRSKNALGTMMQSFFLAGLITIQWAVSFPPSAPLQSRGYSHRSSGGDKGRRRRLLCETGE
ncbi:MAG: hypothetical protein AB7I96_10220, partial [Candidatus Dadabacteria bacterium]